MRVYRSLDQIDRAEVSGGSLSVGNFDGVHLGHQLIIAEGRRIALPAVAMTFDPHPLAVLSPRQAPPMMTPLELKVRLLGEAGADAVVVLPTDRSLLALDPEQFVRDVVAARIGPRAMIEGPGFGFGRGRAGDIDTLRQLGGSFGFDVHVVVGVARVLAGSHEPSLVSSTLVRRLIGGGSVEAAAQCLGRPYRLVGRPVSGRGRGRKIGFPTINVDTGAQLLPAEGVYAGLARCGGFEGPAAINIGPAPTFDHFQPAVEAHLVDLAGSVACEQIELDVAMRLRGVERFRSSQALVRQITRDVEQVRRLMKAAERGAK